VKTHLLIDGDIVAFVSAAAAQRHLEDSYGYIRPFANIQQGEALVENMLYALKLGLKADSASIYLSDPEHNWRREVDPTYKTNRTGERPLLLDNLKGYLREKHGAVHWDGLEADDTLSLLMTEPQVEDAPTQLICVGRDKDFKTIPGLHHSWKQDLDASGNMAIREVTPWEADRFHMMQTLAGDRTDGFNGCPGIGMDRAAQIIDRPMRLLPQPGVKTRGVNKGESVTRWMSEPTRDYWACIVSHYRKAGLTEADALTTARLARLLRHGEYDKETGAITLWTPDKLPKA
jgi:DNA polymerase I